MSNIHKLTISCAACLFLLLATPSYADSETDAEKTFMQAHLAGALTEAEKKLAEFLPDGHLLPKPITLNANWSWQALSGKSLAYEITINTSSNWKLAYLCVDGHLIKIIKSSQNQFNWSFHTLDAGAHSVELLIIGSDGQRGFLDKEIIR